MSPSQAYALILSGGIGERFGSPRPKHFALLRAKPLFVHSLLAFLSWKKNIQICLVVPAQHAKETQEIAEKFLGEIKDRGSDFPSLAFVPGGAKRHLSCLVGLRYILKEAQDEDIIFIHDAARPFICSEELDRLWEEILSSRSRLASLASPFSETLVKAKLGPGQEQSFGPISSSLERDGLYAVKTPQGAKASTLKEMLGQEQRRDDFTDLLTWAEYCGIKGSLVEAGPYNWKVTRKAELEFLEAVMDL